MLIEIKNRWTGKVLFAHDQEENSLKITLKMAVMAGANLNGASLDGANLNGASLDGANLNGANLNGAILNGASLVGASLDGASLYRERGKKEKQFRG